MMPSVHNVAPPKNTTAVNSDGQPTGPGTPARRRSTIQPAMIAAARATVIPKTLTSRSGRFEYWKIRFDVSLSSRGQP